MPVDNADNFVKETLVKETTPVPNPRVTPWDQGSAPPAQTRLWERP